MTPWLNGNMLDTDDWLGFLYPPLRGGSGCPLKRVLLATCLEYLSFPSVIQYTNKLSGAEQSRGPVRRFQGLPQGRGLPIRLSTGDSQAGTQTRSLSGLLGVGSAPLGNRQKQPARTFRAYC